MAKRGSSGVCRLLAINKSVGMSSHDVVNRVRRIFNERRVGHAGTLDPLASGVLLVCVGPATRLDAFLVGHGKRYRMGVMFGISTTTDDSEGDILKTLPVPDTCRDFSFAKNYVSCMVGKGEQVPPIYSAIKVNGKKSYEQARKGTIIDLAPRSFEIFDATCDGVQESIRKDGEEGFEWFCEMSVSSGTYMRSIARDMGRDLHTAAYVSSLERLRSGTVALDDCVTLEQLEEDPDSATLDPLQALGVRFSFARDKVAEKVEHGSWLKEADLSLNEPLLPVLNSPCTCTTNIRASLKPPTQQEIIGVIVNNRLKALYEYQESEHRYVPRCVFSIGVERGKTV
ncbi:MAG: tRNA pseudouridine(55) synthase TruB [Eggerthellaceae bacterium]|nr:tRNA pseudouridine(55) synthase TruB [Eggerthellaceae bacterium]